MVQRYGDYEGKPYTLERYESIDEFLRTVEARPITPQYRHHSDADEIRGTYSDPYFHGVKNYDEARQQFIDGTKAKGEMSKAFAATQTSRKRHTVNAICGCAPIVPKALMGVPNSMIDIRRKRVPKSTKVVVNMSIKYGTTSSQITEAGKKIIAAVGKLEAQGISTEIICTADKFVNEQISSCGISIKNSGQAFSAARVSFSMSSPAFLRTFQWLQLMTNPKAQYASGLGANIAYTWSGDTLARYYRTMYGNGIYISLPDVVKRGQAEIERAINEWQTRR